MGGSETFNQFAARPGSSSAVSATVHQSDPLSVNLEEAALDPYIAFNDRLGRERVLFGPLSEAGIAPCAKGMAHGETR